MDKYSVDDNFYVSIYNIKNVSDPRPIILKFPNGTEKSATIEWTNFTPKIILKDQLNFLGCPIDIKPRFKGSNTLFVKKFLTEKCRQIGVPFEELTPEEPPIELSNDIIPTQRVDLDEYEYRLIKGQVQSGKSFSKIYKAINNILCGLSTFIVVRDRKCDCEQLLDRLRGTVRYINDILKNYGEKGINVNIFKLKRCLQIMDNGYPVISVVLYNKKQLGDLRNYIDEHRFYQKYVLMIDEVDLLDSNNGSNSSDLLIDLKYMSRRVYGVSATVTDQLVQEELESSTIQILKACDLYKDYSHIQFKNIQELPVKNDVHITDLDPIKTDPSIKDFLKKFSRWVPVKDKNTGLLHPVMYLMKISNYIEPMKNIQDYIRDEYPEDIVTLVYTGDGIRMHIPDYDIATIYTFGNEYSRDENGYFNIRKGIAKVIGYLKRNGGIEKFPRILILSGGLAGRGISFVDDGYGRSLDNKNDLGWHLIGMYFRCSKSMPQPELIQSLRLCGRIKDTVPLRMYCTAAVQRDILNAHKIVDKLLYGSIKVNEENGMTSSEAVYEVPVDLSHKSKRRVARNHRIERKINYVNETEDSKGSGEIFVILPETLVKKSRKYYQYFIDVIDRELGTGVWEFKYKIMRYTSSQHGITEELLNNTSHPWHDKNKAVRHSTRTSDETSPGLLFKQHHDGHWLMRYNV